MTNITTDYIMAIRCKILSVFILKYLFKYDDTHNPNINKTTICWNEW